MLLVSSLSCLRFFVVAIAAGVVIFESNARPPLLLASAFAPNAYVYTNSRNFKQNRHPTNNNYYIFAASQCKVHPQHTRGGRHHQSALRLVTHKKNTQGFDPTGLSNSNRPSSGLTRNQLVQPEKKKSECLIPLRARTQKDGGGGDDSSEDSSSLSWIFTLVIPLWLIYISNQWSRSSLYYLVDFSNDADPSRAMNVDIGFTEAQYGFLASLAFTALYAIASLAAGIISDRFNRKNLSISAAVVWSVATLGTSLSNTYPEVLSWRIAMGLACAFVTPPAYTLIAERVPQERVSFASSLYGTGVALGGAFASLSILLDNSLGWREAMQVIGVYGIVVAGIATLVLPNDPKESDNAPLATLTGATTAGNKDSNKNNDIDASGPVPNSFLSDVQEAISTPRVRWLFLASFLRFSSGLCIGIWSAPYYRLIFPDNQGDYAVAQALITAVGGSASGLLGGYIADSLSAKGEEQGVTDTVGRKLWIPVVGSVLAAPTWYFAVESSQSFEVAMAWLAVEFFVAECWFGPTISVLQKTVGPKIGGTSQGLFTLTGAAANLAPSLLGYLYGQQQVDGQESSSELAGLLVTGICFCYLSCAFAFGMAAISSPPETEGVKQP